MGQPWSTLEGQLVTLSNAGATNWITSKKKCCRKHHFSSPTRPKITHTQNRKILHFALWSHIVLCRTYYVRRPRFHFKLHFIHSAVTLLFWLLKKTWIISSSSHIQSVLIGVEYWNYCWALDVYLLFAAWMGQSQSKLIHIFVSYKSVIYFWFCLPK